MDRFDWSLVFQIIRDFAVPVSEKAPHILLAEVLERDFPADRGVFILEIRNKTLHCIRWPDYAACMIESFNRYYCYRTPRVSYVNHILNPVNWSSYRDTEYERALLRPLNIGYTIGFGVIEPTGNNEKVFCIQKSRSSHGFDTFDFQLFSSIQPLIQSLYTMRKKLYSRSLEEILPRELIPGCHPLSFREREVLERLATRESMGEIALKLGISRRTVETHAYHIYQKLCFSSRVELQSYIKEMRSGI